MMNRVSRSIFAGAALAMVLAGCQKSDAPAITSNGAPPQPVTNVTPSPQMPKGDPSVPDASTVFAAQDAAEKAKAMQDTAVAQQKPAPQEEMTKPEESTAMPLPGQANDHSTTAPDKNKGG
jgi:PBP1b-binding outer membrane lipoprotein LpoB